MKTQGGKSGGGARKYGRNKVKCDLYARGQRRYKAKLKRILKSGGAKAAAAYKRRKPAHATRYTRRKGA